MHESIDIDIEGPDAHRAMEELLAIPGIQGNAEPAEPGRVYRDAGVLVAVGAIIGIAGGVAQIASSIIDWRDRWKNANQSKRLSVTIQDARGNRLALDNATPEQITAALKTLVP